MRVGWHVTLFEKIKVAISAGKQTKPPMIWRARYVGTKCLKLGMPASAPASTCIVQGGRILRARSKRVAQTFDAERRGQGKEIKQPERLASDNSLRSNCKFISNSSEHTPQPPSFRLGDKS